MRDLTALILSDGRPGHYHLAEGIVAALARRAHVTTLWQDVHRRRWLPARALARLPAASVGPAAILRLGYGIDAARLPEADVIVSAGGNTLAANIAAARHLGAPNIFYGSLRAYPADAFALVLTSYADQVRTPHPVMTLKPSKLDPDTIPPARIGAERTLAVLVGGNGGGVNWSTTDWTALIALLRNLAALPGLRLNVANAPRTPATASDALAALALDQPAIGFLDIRSAGTGTLAGLLADSDLVLVTADSSTMLSEAIWARRPTLALVPAAADLPAREAAYRAHLEGNDWCRSLPLAGLDAAALLTAATGIVPMTENPLDVLAQRIATGIPGLIAPAA